MGQAAFKTNPISLEELLRDCGSGKIQLPDFQRSWVWDEERIKSLIASISQAFPIGALMTLELRSGAANTFARRAVEGASREAAAHDPDQLLLDGQQRLTSLYQTCIRREVVATITPRQKFVKRWFYFDIRKALEPGMDREDAIVGVPEDKKIKTNFDKDVLMNLSTPEHEYENLMFPLNRAFDWDTWREGFDDHWIAKSDLDKRKTFRAFRETVLDNFKSYHVPVIALGHDTSHEAVCLVFEKVNTGGKPLDAFELVTAMYAAQGYRLRDDWLGSGGQPGIQSRLQVAGRMADQKYGVLEKVASTDLLQAVALLHTKAVRAHAVSSGVKEADLPAVRATRQSLLDLPLAAYKANKDGIEEGFLTAAKFLRQQRIYRVNDLPYQTQLVPLAAILAEIGNKWEHAENRRKLERWFWCGIFGELYGSAVESRFVKDIVEVPAWIDGGQEPSTVRDGVFRTDRLRTMRSRLSAAYKGIHALLMQEHAKDFRSGQEFDHIVFFDEGVDIHHIFPEKWCRDNKIEPKIYDSIINKTPLSYRTNRIIGGEAPSKYLNRLQTGSKRDPAITPNALDDFLRSHCVSPALLRADAFAEFMKDRETRLLALIEKATGHSLLPSVADSADEEDVPDDIARDSGSIPIAAE